MNYWRRITDPSDNEQRRLFEESKDVYERLFDPRIREPWPHFASYICQTGLDEASKGEASVTDFYYVALIDDHVRGIMFFTAYPLYGLGFLAYMGMLTPRAATEEALDEQALRALRRKTEEAKRQMLPTIASALNKAECGGYLFEVAKVRPEMLSPRARRRSLSPDEAQMLDCIRLLNLYQRQGAWKIPWVKYRQPKLRWHAHEQERPMHLMWAPTFRILNEPETLSRTDVERYVHFVYKVFYLDGFKDTVGLDVASISDWEAYLEELCQFAIQGVPETVRLQQVDLSRGRESLFISYPQEDVDLAQTAQEYLESLGFPTLYWERDKRHAVGRRAWGTIFQWIDQSSYILLLLTPNSEHSDGQIKELDYMKARSYVRAGDKTILPMLDGRVKSHVFTKWIPSELTYASFQSSTFPEALEPVSAVLLAGN